MRENLPLRRPRRGRRRRRRRRRDGKRFCPLFCFIRRSFHLLLTRNFSEEDRRGGVMARKFISPRAKVPRERRENFRASDRKFRGSDRRSKDDRRGRGDIWRLSLHFSLASTTLFVRRMKTSESPASHQREDGVGQICLFCVRPNLFRPCHSDVCRVCIPPREREPLRLPIPPPRNGRSEESRTEGGRTRAHPPPWPWPRGAIFRVCARRTLLTRRGRAIPSSCSLTPAVCVGLYGLVAAEYGAYMAGKNGTWGIKRDLSYSSLIDAHSPMK